MSAFYRLNLIRREPASLPDSNLPPVDKETIGTRAADALATLVGSWRFIIIQSVLLMVWIILNVVSWSFHWDPYPFILMNLVLSTQAAFTAPILMMSQNRLAKRDRMEAHNDYLTDVESEKNTMLLLEHLATQSETLATMQKTIAALHEEVRQLKKAP